MSLWNTQARLLELAQQALPHAFVEQRALVLSSVPAATQHAVYLANTWEEEPTESPDGRTVQQYIGSIIVAVRSAPNLGSAQAAADLIRAEWATDPTLQGLAANFTVAMALGNASPEGIEWALAQLDLTVEASSTTLPGIVSWAVTADPYLQDEATEGDSKAYLALLAGSLEAALLSAGTGVAAVNRAQQDIGDLSESVPTGEIVYQLLAATTPDESQDTNTVPAGVAVELTVHYGLPAGVPESSYLDDLFQDQIRAVLNRDLWRVGRPDVTFLDAEALPDLDFPGSISRSA